MHRAGVAAERENGAFGQGGELEQVGAADDILRAGFHLEDLRPDIAFGLGAVPGVLAIAIHTAGALGKLFSEVAENIDMKPVEGVTSTGANWVQVIRFAVAPQVLSNFASYALLRFEINVRGASVMGFVGAGGIGQDLIEAIRKFYYADVSAILLLIILTVMLIDLATERLRHALLGLEGKR